MKTKIVQDNSQTTSRICQLSVAVKKDEGHNNLGECSEEIARSRQENITRPGWDDTTSGKGSWNSLPDRVVEASSIKCFERRLDKHWRDQDLIFKLWSSSEIGSQAIYKLTALHFCSKSDEDLDTQD